MADRLRLSGRVKMSLFFLEPILPLTSDRIASQGRKKKMKKKKSWLSSALLLLPSLAFFCLAAPGDR